MKTTIRSCEPGSDAFSPALIGLQATAPHPAARAVMTALFLVLALMLTWAAWGRLDIVAVAEGRLIPASRVKIVQPAEAGILREILVAEGQRVDEGQVLLRMDRAVSEADGRAVSHAFSVTSLGARRVEAELDGGPLRGEPDDPAPLLSQAHAQLEANRRAHQAALAEEQMVGARARHELAAAHALRGKLERTLPVYRDQEQAFERLVRDGFAGRLMADDKRRQRLEQEGEIATQAAMTRAAEAAVARSDRRLGQLEAERRQRLEAERLAMAAERERLRQELVKLGHRNELLDLRAPRAGIVKDLATHTAGAVTAPGTVLLTLVPADEPLRAEVWVANDDIGFVRPQQDTALKIAAYPFQRYGLLRGTVLQVGADATDGPPAAESPRGEAGALRYRALIALADDHLALDGSRLALSPGMQVAAEIHLGHRSVLEYVLSPLREAFHDAARER